jgi:hypothetical protein
MSTTAIRKGPKISTNIDPLAEFAAHLVSTKLVFDPTAWSKANPGQDVNAAIAEAKRQGYEVKQ